MTAPAESAPRRARRLRAGLLALLVVGAAAVMAGLGVWQLNRLAARRAQNAVVAARLAAPALDVNAQPEAAPPEYQPVRAAGVYDFAHEIVLRNRARQDVPGGRVLTPLRLAGSDRAVLVDRGWLPYAELEPARRAAYQAPVGEVVVSGIARPSQARAFAFLPADPTQSPALPRLDAWYWANLPQIQQQVPYPLLPFYLEAAAEPGDTALPIAGYEVDLSDGPHLSYAIQWFAFAAILLVGSGALWRQRRRRAPAALSAEHG
jgi:surfeit locus 1 family protein